MQIEYYLFGSDAVSEFEDTGTVSPDNSGALFIFDPEKQGAGDIIEAYDGWLGSTSLTKEQYDELNKLDHL